MLILCSSWQTEIHAWIHWVHKFCYCWYFVRFLVSLPWSWCTAIGTTTISSAFKWMRRQIICCWLHNTFSAKIARANSYSFDSHKWCLWAIACEKRCHLHWSMRQKLIADESFRSFHQLNVNAVHMILYLLYAKHHSNWIMPNSLTSSVKIC